MADYYLTQTGPEVQDILDSVGDLDNLTTTDKDTVVDAVNEVDGNIGDLSSLTTTDKDTVVDAINELDVDVGDLSDLTTTDKDSVVDAINEVASMSPEIATVSTPGIVQPDGTTIGVDAAGIISIIGSAVGFSIDLLWTNSSPSANFANQTLDINLSSYDAVLILMFMATTRQQLVSFLYTIDETQNRVMMISDYVTRRRDCDISSSGIVFGHGFYYASYGTDSITQADNCAIPYRIYGIK